MSVRNTNKWRKILCSVRVTFLWLCLNPTMPRAIIMYHSMEWGGRVVGDRWWCRWIYFSDVCIVCNDFKCSSAEEMAFNSSCNSLLNQYYLHLLCKYIYYIATKYVNIVSLETCIIHVRVPIRYRNKDYASQNSTILIHAISDIINLLS